jgi:membrane fusion protein, adhesin transport system
MRTPPDSKKLTAIPLLALFALVAFVVWASIAEIDQISRAQGQVIPVGRIQVVQSADGGVIQEILVREGDVVKSGQLLVQLDAAKIAASVAEGEAKVASIKGTLARIEAELFDRALVFPKEVDDYPEVIANQSLLYSKRKAALEAEIDTLRSVQQIMRQELQMNEPLLAFGDVSRTEILRLERQLTEVSGQIANRRAKYVQDLQAEYTKFSDDLVTSEQSLAQRRDALSYTQLIAPTNGIVKNIRLTTVGAVLRSSDEVLQIVPTGEELIVEGRVDTSDIAFIRVGQEGNVKFDAYDSAIYGSANARVSFISADSIVEEAEDGRRSSFYRVRVSVDTASMRTPSGRDPIEIQPGMTVTVEIKTGKNTVLRYLTKPILKTFSESLTEK